MKTILSTFICLALLWVNGENNSTISIEGSEHDLNYAYAIRIPGPFEEKEITRLIFLKNALTNDELSDEIAMIQAFHAEDQGGVYIDVKDDGTAISTRMKWGEHTTMWSSDHVSELHFEGTINRDHISGTITTDPPLSIYGSDVKWSISGTVDKKIEHGWSE